MKYALLIGANYSRDPLINLKGCIDDITNMKDMLIGHYGYDISNIVMLRDDVDTEDMLPTKTNMINRMNEIVSKSKYAEEIWIHYSGHGSLLSQFVNKYHDIDN